MRLSSNKVLDLELQAPRHIGLIGHVIADYPTPADAHAMIAAMVDADVRVVEIQIPFSEPMADGPVFLAANHQAIARGVGYTASLALMREMTQLYPQVHFVFMTYLNIIFKRGYTEFVSDALAAGAGGVIVPDLPLEHAEALNAACDARGFINISLIPPNSPDSRLRQLCARARGFVYAVARSGVTGAGTQFSMNTELPRQLTRIREHTQVPIAVGFGVRSAEDVQSLRGLADYAIVGTRSLQVMEEAGIEGFQRFWRGLATNK